MFCVTHSQAWASQTKHASRIYCWFGFHHELLIARKVLNISCPILCCLYVFNFLTTNTIILNLKSINSLSIGNISPVFHSEFLNFYSLSPKFGSSSSGNEYPPHCCHAQFECRWISSPESLSQFAGLWGNCICLYSGLFPSGVHKTMRREGERGREGEIWSYMGNGEKVRYYYANGANQQG